MYDPEKECKRVKKRINELRQIKGITKNTLAKKAGISNSTLSYLLGGKSTPYLYTLLQICNALEVSVSELMSDGPMEENQQETHNSPQIREQIQRDRLYNRICHLSDTKAEMLNKYIDFLEQYPE